MRQMLLAKLCSQFLGQSLLNLRLNRIGLLVGERAIRGLEPEAIGQALLALRYGMTPVEIEESQIP